MTVPTLHWTILGTGMILTQFIEDLNLSQIKGDPHAKHIVKSIGVLTKSKGENFVKKYLTSGKQDHPAIESYDDAVANKDSNIVYIGLPHTSHYEYTKKALEAGKHVLCEKPFTVNKKQAAELVELARSKKLFLMEAVWTRFFPIIRELVDLVHVQKVIGDVSRIIADFSIDMKLETLGPDSRLKNPKFAGGALLDIGGYTLTYWRLFLDLKLGKSAVKYEVKLNMQIVEGIDHQTNTIIKQQDGKQAILTNSFLNRCATPFARIDGSKGTLFIGGEKRLMSEPTWYKLDLKDGTEKEKTMGQNGYHGLIHEANYVAKDIAEGKTESDIMPLDETLLVMGTLDEIRRQNGLSFPEVLYDDEL